VSPTSAGPGSGPHRSPKPCKRRPGRLIPAQLARPVRLRILHSSFCILHFALGSALGSIVPKRFPSAVSTPHQKLPIARLRKSDQPDQSDRTDRSDPSSLNWPSSLIPIPSGTPLTESLIRSFVTISWPSSLMCPLTDSLTHSSTPVLGPTARLIPAQGGVSAAVGSEPQEKDLPR